MNTWDANSFDWKALEEIYWWVKGHQAHHHGIWELPSGSDRHVLIAAGNILLGMAFLDTLPGSRNILNPMTLPREYFATFPSGGEAEADEFETQMKAQAAYPKEAAEVATDTASFYTIAPEQLATVFEDGKWTEHAKALWKDHKGDTTAHVRAMDKIIRQHGGAVFNTGADGVWEMKVFDIDDKPMAESSKGLHVEEKGMLSRKSSHRIALRYLGVLSRNSSSRGTRQASKPWIGVSTNDPDLPKPLRSLASKIAKELDKLVSLSVHIHFLQRGQAWRADVVLAESGRGYITPTIMLSGYNGENTVDVSIGGTDVIGSPISIAKKYAKIMAREHGEHIRRYR